ncbi:MAG TPA: potassium channel family protein [Candidatus Angelobacter sp.]
MRDIDGMPLSILFLIVCGSLLLFAMLYWLAGRYGQGPVSGDRSVSFRDCVYFSVVTFSSLGYGDILPRGISKVFASVEVFFGLALFGIFIAKLSSSKQSYHLAQLYARDVQEKLDNFSIILKDHRTECREALETLKRGEELERALNKIQNDVHITALRIRAYVSFEISNGDFLLETPIGAAARLMKRSTQVVQRVSALACYQVSRHTQRQRGMAKRSIQQFANIGKMVRDNSEDLALQSEAANLIEKCEAAKVELDAIVEHVSAKFHK